ncbi:MAG: transposase [Chlorobium sp.]|uniref:transposase n=1 Tax=Chlorobium sp. TaxID=1095 RepID=UPI0025BF4959|nr:transposase [Chlorobium sp.]MCF8383637.1 transposase [Chlorobium sp.]
MPRVARLDAPGTLHHVMVRGIEGGPIVTDDHDREQFVSRTGLLSRSTGTTVYAWALMTNHSHLLLRSGHAGISGFMRKLLTGYAISYNLRHKRHGYLFQNRYKSIVCQEDGYFQKLVSYIHLNPFRAGLVRSLDELDDYPWTGHAVLMNRASNDWQDRDYVLSYFGEKEGSARQSYREFIAEQSVLGRQPELVGGGLVRSAGGWSEVKALRKRGELQLGDARILGDGDFVKTMLDEAEESRKELLCVYEMERKAEDEMEKKCEQQGVSKDLLQKGSRQAAVSKLREELAALMVDELGLTQAATARLLGISTSGVAGILRRVRGGK